jgi:NAD(P)-dependent dehydrogenase (short-subunit alcohol dehydrogenase family)
VSEVNFSLSGKRVIVTGASRGIGRGLAVAFAEHGARVACVARGRDALDETVAMIEAVGGSGYPIVADLGDETQLDASFDAALAALGGLDVLVNNAGTDGDTTALDLEQSTWDRMQSTNLRTPFVLAQRAGRVMVEQGRGKIINVGSIGSHVGWSGDLTYLVTKHGLLGLTRALAVEWGPAGVQVNLLCPGFVDTEMTADVIADPERNAWVLSHTPLGRWGQVDEIVGAGVFLASDASSFMTGQSLIVDGGWTAQ